MHKLTVLPARAGGYHFGILGNGQAFPLGDCREHAPHPTEHEARECYSAWLRDNITLDGLHVRERTCQHPGCETPATLLAVVKGDYQHTAVLCPTHYTPRDTAKAMGIISPASDETRL